MKYATTKIPFYLAGFMLLAFLTLSGCSRKNLATEADFWTNINPEEHILTLFVNDEEIGIIPYNEFRPDCGEARKTLKFPMEFKRYKIKAVDQNGLIIAEGDFTYRANYILDSRGVTGPGGFEVIQIKSCMWVQVYGWD